MFLYPPKTSGQEVCLSGPRLEEYPAAWKKQMEVISRETNLNLGLKHFPQIKFQKL